jgi:hypothetical protein
MPQCSLGFGGAGEARRAAALMARVFRTAADIADALGRDSLANRDWGGARGGPGSLCEGAGGEFSTSPTD